MGVGRGNKVSGRSPRRAYYPSGPWVDGIKPPGHDDYRPGVAKVEPPPLGNPDPDNYQIVKAEEHGKWLILQMKYPDCTNFEGQKILVFKDATLIELVNQKLIDPHFFNDKKFKSPVARFVPTEEGWAMARTFVTAMNAKPAKR